MSIAFTPSICHINLSAISRNFQKLGEPAKLMPVIKSDAYGHGLTEVAQVLGRAGAERFAVGLADEGATLRQLGHKQDIILLLGCLCDGDWELALRYNLAPAINSFEELKRAQALLAKYPGKTLPVAIKVDTGMSRLGFDPEDGSEVADFLAENKGIEPKILISHLACADAPEEDEFTCSQTSAFDQFYGGIKAKFPEMPRSLANSAATISGRENEIGRPGLALYGYNPLPGPDAIGLERAMSVSTPIIQIRDLKPGQSVSYGRTFKAEKPMRIAIAACGYASGFARRLSNKAHALVNGKRARQIGRVCMSMACLDITDIEGVHVGDSAWIMGGEGDNPVSATEIANELGTIPYEVLCLMGELNPRVYYR